MELPTPVVKVYFPMVDLDDEVSCSTGLRVAEVLHVGRVLCGMERLTVSFRC